MDPVKWVKSKGLAYVVFEAAAAICILLLLAVTALKLANAAVEPGIDTTLVAVLALFLAIVGKQFDRSTNEGASA